MDINCIPDIYLVRQITEEELSKYNLKYKEIKISKRDLWIYEESKPNKVLFIPYSKVTNPERMLNALSTENDEYIYYFINRKDILAKIILD